MKSYIITFMAVFAMMGSCEAARPMKGAATAEVAASVPGRRLSQAYSYDPYLSGTKVFADQHFSRMSRDAAATIISNDAQSAAKAADLRYLADTMNTQTWLRQKNSGAVKDLINTDVQIAATNAASSGDAASASATAIGTSNIWTTAAWKPSQDVRNALGQDQTQQAIMQNVDEIEKSATPATQTGIVHAQAVSMPTSYFNWRRRMASVAQAWTAKL